MEFPQRFITIERVLALLAGTSLLILGLMEQRSHFASALRQGRPWVEMRIGANPSLSIYRPNVPSLSVLPLQKRDEDAVRSIVLRLSPAELGTAFPAKACRIASWNGVAIRPVPDSLDGFLWDVEMARLKPAQIIRAVLPKTELKREELIARLLYPERIRPHHTVTAEIFNDSEIAGLALKAAKVLRSNGVDVVAIGNGATPVSSTMIYDRTGNPEVASVVRRALGCPAAQTETDMNEKRFVDASVILAKDCSPQKETFNLSRAARSWRRIFFKAD